METYYVLIVGVLFILAVSDLIVGVSNDAVNFLNSAIGSKAAPFWIIMAIAAAGVLVGATFSNGMMEVARKGIFNPQMFAFSEIMVLFLAVMLTDILLLDFFNTMGLPTSTTVSIVFELLGSAVAVATFKLARMGELANKLGDYINTERAVLIVAGIFLSIIIAFTVGMIIMWLVRFAFTFNIPKTSRYWSGLWGGIAITAILYFLLIKGAKGSTLVSDEALAFIRDHTFNILIVSLLGWILILQLLALFTRVNILKVTVLVGTFALAMAFAGNDLVNFIGVPLAGFESYKAFAASGSADPGGFLMGALQGPVRTPLMFLLAAGMIMVVTLRFSKKARSVTATTIDLSRQAEGAERFASSALARFIVRRSVEFSNSIARVSPDRIKRYINQRFDGEKAPVADQKVAFDLARASVNLVVASILIAIGTSLKLPLSTTYVTFMVAMGTSLADGAWGRESAVYRITGVLTVIGGWFFTAFIAFCVSFIVATMLYFGKLPVMLVLIGISAFILYRTHAIHKKRNGNNGSEDERVMGATPEILEACNEEVQATVVQTGKIIFMAYRSFFKEKYKDMKKLKKEARHLNKDVRKIRDRVPETLRHFSENDSRSEQHYVQLVEYMKEMTTALTHIIQPAFNHLDNNHSLDSEQSQELGEFNEKLSEFFNYVINLLKNGQSDQFEELNQRRDELLEMINQIQLKRIKILKKTQKGVKVSVTYMDMLNETKNLLLNVVHLTKSRERLMKSTELDTILENQ